jgi:alpha-glucosidase (family GH31 glycosyl hydrolase)
MSPLAEKTVFHPSTYDYKLGEDILVCPVTKANTTSRSVTFPSGDNWVDWYAPKKIYSGGSKVQYDTSSLAIFPVFQRQGSILPLNVTSSYTNHGSEFSAGALTLLVGQISDTNRGSS